jgi:hypothetical protein
MLVVKFLLIVFLSGILYGISYNCLYLIDCWKTKSRIWDMACFKRFWRYYLVDFIIEYVFIIFVVYWVVLVEAVVYCRDDGEMMGYGLF